MSDIQSRAIIVGAGHAGGSLATMLRTDGWAGPISVFGAEDRPPYQRPPLSKALLADKCGIGSLELRKPEYWGEHGIDLHLGARVARIERDASRIVLADGETAAYDVLILATGLEPRRLPVPGGDLDGVVTLRDIDDCLDLRTRLGAAKRMVVIGAGWIGLEVAATAVGLGVEVTVLERETRALARVSSPEISAYFTSLHERAGVRFVFGADVSAVVGEEGRARSVRTADGRVFDADVVLVGIGGIATAELAEAAGLDCRGGVLVDGEGRTSDPAIRAIGDVTLRPLPFVGGTGRLESVQSALEQARRVSADLCGKPLPAPEAPWFWSDQYATKLQIAGLTGGAVRRVVRGSSETSPFSVFHLAEDDGVLAVEAVDAQVDYMVTRQWIAAGTRVDPARLADPSIPVRQAALARAS